jgi:MSHA biogenesis protein MshN
VSVINKMLRDLDHRQAPGLGLPLRSGTASLAAEHTAIGTPKAPTFRGWRIAFLGLCMGVLAAGWAWQAGLLAQLHTAAVVATVPAPAPAAIALAVAVPVATPASAPAPVLAEPEPEPQPVNTATTPLPGSPAVDLRMDNQLPMRKLVETPVIAAPVAAPTVKPAMTERTLPPAPTMAAVRATTSTPPVPQTPAPDTAQRQQQVGKEAIAHAQGLWNAGSKDAAIDLLQEAVSATERTAVASPGNVPMLGALVRELTRMQLAEARPAPVLALLIRLEPLLGNLPDLWAVRANAAQRLGQHQESVRAYLIALQSRPGEQRWLLGAAVSLAALGQTAGSADMVDKARAAGPIGTEVQAYLRQMGVPLVDR